MFDLVISAGVRPHDFAAVLNVSRCTVSTWFNNKAKPHVLINDRVKQAIAAVNDAVTAGDLPLPRDTPIREKSRAMYAVLSKYLTQ